mmetsp:Transcript_12809/g.28851  ORF Transcript_12809/g.28851 Transcript_12809/m.28851 type:complete len:104 (-) Transcript_12809:110-421(-)
MWFKKLKEAAGEKMDMEWVGRNHVDWVEREMRFHQGQRKNDNKWTFYLENDVENNEFKWKERARVAKWNKAILVESWSSGGFIFGGLLAVPCGQIVFCVCVCG